MVLKVREAHLMAVGESHQMFNMQLWNLADTIGLIVILAAVGFCCWKLRGCFSNDREPEATVIVVPPNNANSRAPPSPRNAPNTREEPVQQIDYDRYKMKSEPLSKKAVPAAAVTGNPYILQNQYTSPYRQWSVGKDFLSVKKQGQNCLICTELVKDGQRPRVVVGCSEDHCFHSSCLSEHRSRIIRFMEGNGLFKCPACKQTYPANVHLYCNSCRNMKIDINLSQMSENSGKLKMSELRDIYGQSCQNCRVI